MATQRELVERLFKGALDVKLEERSAFLDRECNGNAELRQEVESLLAGADASHVRAQPTADVSSTQRATSATVIGPYHLLELIGEGGMGQVWLAEQKQPVRRRVAIKLIKAGMDTREVVARFESERQALALMDHPAIAKVFEAGSTPEGRPYFVMEYVPGLPITDYCDRHKLTIRQRMELFIQVCEGVQHAHQKAIIHRDLKPSNVLVSEIDGKPMPRIIDFGVAKATSQKLTAETMYTRIGTMVGTLGYMSPEQADPIREDVDIRTDVYSLGAVLYELLTGAQPLNLEKLTYDEVLRVLRDQDAPRPSTKIPMLGADSTISATNRGSDPPTLVRQLRGDPDAIALKALEKDRARRYASASELAADIGRYLHNEPVTAHPPSITYRTRKFLRRNKLGLAVAASAALAIALLVTWWRMPPAVPVVESVVQLTDDGQPKSWFVSDGSRIYFIEGRTILQVPATGGPVTPVVTGLWPTELEGMARDGSGLLLRFRDHVFTSGGRPAPSELYEDQPLWWIPLPAEEPRRLGNLNAAGADVLPDGRIVFGKTTFGEHAKGTDNRTEWFIADKDGSNPRKLASFPGYAAEVWASPDGRRILLSQELESDRRLFEIRVDGTGLREIRRLNDNEYNFVWTPDEKYLVYQSGNASQSDIWLLPMRTGLFRRPGKPIRLTNGPIPYSDPYPSRGGKQIFVLGTKQRGELVRYDMQSHELAPLLSGISATDPTFSRDGKWVAYLSYPDHTLWRSRSDGTERKQLTFPPTTASWPFISPDGTKVAFSTVDKPGLYVVDMDGGAPQKISDDSAVAAWSPDGNYLYAHPIAQDSGSIIDIHTAKRSVVPSSRLFFAYWPSPDILVGTNERYTNFLIFDLKTQKFSDLTQGSTMGRIESWMVSPDGEYFYFTTIGEKKTNVMRLRLTDHQVESIVSLKDFHRARIQINVAPDGSPIFTRDTGYQEIYALNIRWP